MRNGLVQRSLTTPSQETCRSSASPWESLTALCAAGVLLVSFAALAGGEAHAQHSEVALERNGKSIVIEPFAPNILRITLGKSKAAATAAPGYGLIGTPSMDGWTHNQEGDGEDVLRSNRLVLHLSADHRAETQLPHPMPLDDLNLSLRKHYFGGGGGNGPNDGGGSNGPNNDTLSITTPAGKTLLTMQSWSMVQNQPDAKANGTAKPQEADPGHRVSANFDSPPDEHYYGLGQQQQGVMDLRDHVIHCWHDYSATGGESVCVPFMVSTRGYGLIWDNPSKTTIDLGFNQRNVWSSEVGDRVSFYVIAGDTTDEIYKGYRQLTGISHLLPKAAYGYTQSKAIYPTQDQIMAVAKGYRDRHLPLDTLVVDFLNMTRQGEMDLDPARWPGPAAMNSQLHSMGYSSMLSVWPHFSAGTRYYDMLKAKGWLISTADSTPDSGSFTSVIGPNIDTTNPEAAKWFWESIRDRYVKPYNFDAIWLDETEPDVDPAKDFFFIGSGTRYYNAYPFFHTAAVYDGYRRDYGDSRRVFILARAAYLGAQRNGTVFWSSDITSTWDMLKRSIPAGLNFTASGMPYWDTDIAGFFSPSLPANYKAAHTPLIDGSDVKSTIANYEDYPELFVRWFQWGAFQPVMRAHGERNHNEVWAYGKQAEPILLKYLRLRYQMLPYIYSLGYQSYQTGAPFMRALFMDFPADPNVMNIPDEYMFGPAFLVAPVTDQGATHRSVYLPAGSDWYNYWTNERLKGGQTITADAPIDTLPLFVRAGSIVPLGAEISSTHQPQAISAIRVYPGANADFTLYSDDGTTYAYEKTGGTTTQLSWDESTHHFKHQGASAWKDSDKSIVQVIGKSN